MKHRKDNMFKVCTNCNKEKPTEYFSKGKGILNLKHTCKVCDKKVNVLRTEKIKS
jgi:hypothetical protein